MSLTAKADIEKTGAHHAILVLISNANGLALSYRIRPTNKTRCVCGAAKTSGNPVVSRCETFYTKSTVENRFSAAESFLRAQTRKYRLKYSGCKYT